MSEPKITVTRHAVSQYGRRCRDFEALAPLERVDWHLDELKRMGYSNERLSVLLGIYRDLEQDIRACVLRAIQRRRLRDSKPKGFVLYKRKNNGLPPGQFFVLHEQGQHGFIIKREGEREDWVVMTTLSRAGVRH